jgi:Protein of unknown function (DUF1549)/Protein of unknown function (DUF1553)
MARMRLVLLCSMIFAAREVSAQLSAPHPKENSSVLDSRNELTSKVAPVASPSSIGETPVRNYIDKFIFEKMERDHIPHAGLSTDTEFLRRVYLDLTGRLPEPEKIRSFVKDGDSAKRAKVIDALMTTPYLKHLVRDEAPFVDRWTYFFGDMFRNGSAQLGNGRNLFHDYLYMALLMNVPYDELVREMLTARARSNWLDAASNFLIRDHVDDDSMPERINNEDTYDEVAITSAKLFLGVNLECVSCHHGKGHLEKINLGLSRLKRDQLWRQAAFFSQMRIGRPYAIGQEFYLFDTGAGYDYKAPSVMRIPRYKADVSPEFLLTGERPKPGEPWRLAYARMVTGHPQFARATVNLIWAELMGVGIVDPPLEFDLARQDPSNPPPAPWTIQPSHPELLNALAQDFIAHKYDLRYLIRLIVNSSAYQLSAHFDGEWKDSYAPYFARRFVRRFSAEVVCDAISQATGVFKTIAVAGSDVKVKYVLQARSPEDLRGKDLQPMRDLLVSFGQSNRDKGEKDPSGNMVQASELLNGAFVKNSVRVQEGGRLWNLLHRDPALPAEEIADEMFLGFLSRFPRTEEKAIVVKTLNSRSPQNLEDLAWSLINKIEFIHNY